MYSSTNLSNGNLLILPIPSVFNNRELFYLYKETSLAKVDLKDIVEIK